MATHVPRRKVNTATSHDLAAAFLLIVMQGSPCCAKEPSQGICAANQSGTHLINSPNWAYFQPLASRTTGLVPMTSCQS
jgi:hypothetical protein